VIKWRVQVDVNDEEQAISLADLIQARTYETVEVYIIPLEDEDEN